MIPHIGKLIGPAVAVEISNADDDFQPLIDALGSDQPNVKLGAELAFRHFIGALIIKDVGKRSLVGPSAGPWYQLLDAISKKLSHSTAISIRVFLATVCDEINKATDDQTKCLGDISRRVLEYAISRPYYDFWLIHFPLQCICRTFHSNIEQSSRIIRILLDEKRIPQYGHREFPRICDEIDYIIPHDKKLSEEIYRIAFSYTETSEEQTSLSGSHILALTSSKRQDFNMSRYHLAEAFPRYLRQDVESATRSLILVLEGHSLDDLRNEEEEEFSVYDISCRLIGDHSSIWDSPSRHQHEEHAKILSAFDSFIMDANARPDGNNELLKISAVLLKENRIAVLWKRLLKIMFEYPELIGKKYISVLLSIPILCSSDTTVEAGNCIKKVIDYTTDDQRKSIEESILSIPFKLGKDSEDRAIWIRNRILGCIPKDKMILPESKRIIEDLERESSIPENKPLYSISDMEREIDSNWWWKNRNVDVDDKDNKSLLELESILKPFNDKYLNDSPSMDEINRIWTDITNAFLEYTKGYGHEELRVHIGRILVQSLASIAKCDALTCNESLGKFVRTKLLEASVHSDPSESADADLEFDKHISWSPSIRGSAADGLCCLANNKNCVSNEIVDSIERLINDVVPSIRYNVSRRLGYLFYTSNSRMKTFIENRAYSERSSGVLQGLLEAIYRMANADVDWCINLVRVIFERSDIVLSEEAKKLCVRIFVDYYYWRDNAVCRNVIVKLIENPADNHQLLHHLVFNTQHLLTIGPVSPTKEKEEGARKRAFELLLNLTVETKRTVSLVEATYTGKQFSDWLENDRERFRSMYRLLDDVASQLYYASGANDREAKNNNVSSRPLEILKRFYSESAKLFNELEELGLRNTAYHLLQTLECFVPIDAKGVFLRIARIISASKAGGYQYESLGAAHFVGLIQFYLAEHRDIFQSDAICRTSLIEILDIFVDAGWPEARKLTYQLNDIFR